MNKRIMELIAYIVMMFISNAFFLEREIVYISTKTWAEVILIIYESDLM